MTQGPRVECPVCGGTLPVGALRGHVGQTRCLLSFVRRNRDFYDPKYGKEAYDLARQLDKVLGKYRHSKGGD